MARILFVTSRLPWPPREGHQLRSCNLLRAAASRHRVDLLSLLREEDGQPQEPPFRLDSVSLVPLPPMSRPAEAAGVAARALLRARPLLVARYVTPALERAFRPLAAEADLVHFDMLPLAGLAPLVPEGIPVVLNEHNVESELLRRQAQVGGPLWKRLLMRQQQPLLQRFEAAACSRADRVLACSAPDALRLRELSPGAGVDVVPNGVDLQQYDGPDVASEDDASLVFVGGMGWLPNRDGISHFLSDAFPRIRARRNARLVLIGRSDGLRVPPALSGAVDCAGFVDDVRPPVRRAAVYVVPLRAGSGTRLKVLEAMAMGKAIVSTRIGAEGIALRDGEHALLADTPGEFADAVCRLLDDRTLRLRLGSNARRLAEREYGWDGIGAKLLSIYGDLLPSPAPRVTRAA